MQRQELIKYKKDIYSLFLFNSGMSAMMMKTSIIENNIYRNNAKISNVLRSFYCYLFIFK